MLKYRLTLGPVLIAVLAALLWLDGWLDTIHLDGIWQDIFLGREYLPSGLILFGIGLTVLPIASWELVRIFKANQIQCSLFVTSFAAILGFVLHYSIPYRVEGLQAVAIVCSGLVFVFVLSLVWHSRNQKIDGVVAAAGGTMFAMIYLGLMLGFFLAIRRWNSPWLIIAIVMTTKSCDTGAFFTGRLIGKHKLIPWLSPGKTWEGLAGGLITSIGIALLFCLWGRSIEQPIPVHPGLTYNFEFSYQFAAIAGFLFGLVGQMGDLTASLFKRDAGIKDSSHIMPGFGGVLDLLDSPLLVAPLAYWMMQMHTQSAPIVG